MEGTLSSQHKTYCSALTVLILVSRCYVLVFKNWNLSSADKICCSHHLIEVTGYLSDLFVIFNRLNVALFFGSSALSLFASLTSLTARAAVPSSQYTQTTHTHQLQQLMNRYRYTRDNSNPRVGADRRDGAKRIPFLGSGRPVLRNNGSDRIVGATGPSLGLTDQQ